MTPQEACAVAHRMRFTGAMARLGFVARADFDDRRFWVSVVPTDLGPDAPALVVGVEWSRLIRDLARYDERALRDSLEEHACGIAATLCEFGIEWGPP